MILQKNKNKKDSKKFKVAFRFADPQKIIDNLKIKTGSKIADFGSGSGFFTIPLARKVGEKGVIYALDVLPSALESIESQSHTFGLENIIIKRVDLTKEKGSGLSNESVDWVILKDVLFQNQEKKQMLKEAFRILKKGGSVLIMEWNENNFAMGPDIKKRVSVEELSKILIEQGFSVSEPEEAGNFHYILIATK